MLSLQSKVHPAMMINIKADALYTIMDTEFWPPLKMVINNASKPMKHSVGPSAAHSIVMTGLFSSKGPLFVKVLFPDPAGTFLPVPPSGPSPQRLVYVVVYLLEHLLADYVAVIVGPPSEKRVEFFYQLSG